MKPTPLILIVIVSTLLTNASRAQGQGTAFTYQGRLTQSGSPANEFYEMQFTLFDAARESKPEHQSDYASNQAIKDPGPFH